MSPKDEISVQEATASFLKQVEIHFKNDFLIKLTLSKPSDKQATLKNVYIRPVSLKDNLKLSFLYRHVTQDISKNYTIAEALLELKTLLGHQFLEGHLFTTQADFLLLFNKKRKGRLIKKTASQTNTPSKLHDKQKNYLISPTDNPYLQALGIVNQQGKVLSHGQKKFRQINKYIEIIDSLLRQQQLPEAPKIVDMGSGKGYLTFALYDFLSRQMTTSPRITGIELRPKLVEATNKLAAEINYEHLQFAAMDIQHYPADQIDMLIALHACDIATDIAIAKGISSKAEIIVVAPCCHKQVRNNMQPEGIEKELLKHGILMERQAELLTDSIRSLLMEAHGYKTKVFEFISTEHTAKNLMITGIKGSKNTNALAEVAQIKARYGIRYHYLEELLKGILN